jgi:hypothetical protein
MWSLSTRIHVDTATKLLCATWNGSERILKALTLVKFVDPSLVTAGFTALNSTRVENMSRARIVRAARSPLCVGLGSGDLDRFALLLRRVMLQ